MHHSEFLFSLLYNGTQLYLLVFINWHSCWSGKIDQKSLQCTIFIRFPSLFCHYYDSSFMAICSLYMYGIMKKICHHSKSLRIVNPLLIRSWLLIFKPQATAIQRLPVLFVREGIISHFWSTDQIFPNTNSIFSILVKWFIHILLSQFVLRFCKAK